MADERKGGPGIGEGIRAGVGVLMAFKDAIEESVNEALERGDLTPDRARAVIQDASERLQKTVEEARDRLEMVPRKEFEALRGEVAELRARLDRIEGPGGTGVWGDAEPPLPAGGGSRPAGPSSGGDTFRRDERGPGSAGFPVD